MKELETEARSIWVDFIHLMGVLARAAICALSGFGLIWLIGWTMGTDNDIYEVAKFIINVFFVGGAIVVSFLGVWRFCSESYNSFQNSSRSGGE